MARPDEDGSDTADDSTCYIENAVSPSSSIFRLTVEPALLFFTFSITLASAVLQNFIVFRICKNELDYNATVCQSLQSYPIAEEDVQPKAAVLFMSKQVIEAVIPALLSFFLGPWSDMHGRRPLLLVPLAGYAVLYLSFLVFSIETLASQWNVYWVLLPCLLVSTTGGFIAFLTGAFCLIADISSTDERAWRMGVAEAACLVGLPLGLASSSYILDWGGYKVVFGLCALITFMAFIYVWWMVSETVVPRNEMSPSRNIFRSIFDHRLITDMVRTCIKPRPGFRRVANFLIMATLASTLFTFDGELSVIYLFTREKFAWSLREYSLFSSASVCIVTIGTVVGLHGLSKQLKLPDAPLAAFAFLTKALSATTKALAPQPWVLYLGSAFDLLGGVTSPLGRTILSKSVPKEDIGKVFSLTSSIDALTPLASAPLYTLVYDETLSVMPGAFYFVSASIFIIDVIILCIVSVIHYKFPASDYVLLSQETTTTVST